MPTNSYALTREHRSAIRAAILAGESRYEVAARYHIHYTSTYGIVPVQELRNRARELLAPNDIDVDALDVAHGIMHDATGQRAKALIAISKGARTFEAIQEVTGMSNDRVVGAMRGLNKDGLITYRERAGINGHHPLLDDLQLTKIGDNLLRESGWLGKGRRPNLPPTLRAAATKKPVPVESPGLALDPELVLNSGETVSPIAVPPDLLPEPEPEPDPVVPLEIAGFPLLVGLLARRVAKAEAKIASERYLEAASLLADISATESERLQQLAENAEGQPFSAIEIEYLRYADAAGGRISALYASRATDEGAA